jgi:uncharacterized protein (TIGR03435 family)
MVLGALNAPRVRAQSLAIDASVPAFTSVSIRANISGDPRFYPMTMADGRFAVKNLPLRNLIANMYLRDGRLWGGPDWLSDRFDIEATADGKPTREQLRLMVRKLLADRFQLAVRKETLALPVYALVLARSDGTLGPRLRPSSEDCIATVKAMRSGQRPPPPGVVGRDRLPEPAEVPCGGFVARPQGTMTGRAMTMADLAFGGFGPILGRKLVDQTRLAGYFDVDLEYTPAVPPGPPPTLRPPRLPPEQAYGRPAPSISPSFFTAVQEQLGLDLASQTGPVEIVVIDRVGQPVDQ